MRYSKWIGLAAAALLIITCFIPWVIITSKDIVVTGVAAEGTNFGKPGYLNLFFTILFLIFHFIPRIWAKRINLAVVAINLSWAIRNYIVLSTCYGGDCPEKQIGLYLLVLSSVVMLLAGLFPDIKLKKDNS